MVWGELLPEIARKEPSRPLVVRYRSEVVCPAGLLEQRLDQALQSARLEWRHGQHREGGAANRVVALPWRTVVLGVLQRSLREQVAISIVTLPGCQELRLACLPTATHNAHAAGMAAVLVLAVVAWLLGGWSAEGVPAGTATLLIGSLLAEHARKMALTVLERRLQRLAGDLGSDLWPTG